MLCQVLYQVVTILLDCFMEPRMCTQVCLFVFGATAPQWVMGSSFTRYLDHTQGRTTVGMTSLDEWSASRRDLYLATNNTHNRQTSMSSVGFESTTPAGDRQQTYALNRAATGTGVHKFTVGWYKWLAKICENICTYEQCTGGLYVFPCMRYVNSLLWRPETSVRRKS